MWGVVVILVLWLAVAPAAASDHVRVILDTSQSMRDNDKPRLATLATALLYDLANPDLGDTFHVIQFDESVKWNGPPQPPPVRIGPRLVGHPGKRGAFVEAVRAIRYDAAWTHFYPGLRTAVAELEVTPGGLADRRVIVVITDGVPDPGTAEEELQLIRQELVPRLAAGGIRLYFLAFGDAMPNRSFFDRIAGGPAGDIGGVFPDKEGTNLLAHMIEIFSRSFGYVADMPVSAAGPQEIDLAGPHKPSAVAVVVYGRNPEPPRLSLSPTPRSAEGPRQAREVGASYSLLWVERPQPGRYTLAEAPQATVAVLRPVVLRVEVRPQPPSTTANSAMAQVRFPMRVVVSPASGPRGDPGPVDVSFTVHGPDGGDAGGGKRHPAETAGTPVPDGRTFEIVPIFPRDSSAARESYPARLEVFARRRDAIVGSLSGEDAHRVQVYPRVALVASPPAASIAVDGHVRALGAYERGCARFHLDLAAGALPHPQRPAYSLRATLDAGLRRDPRLAGASFALDGHPLELETAPRAAPDAWYMGRRLSAEQLVGEHELCVQTGRPRRADPAVPFDVPLHLTLFEVPYDGTPVISPFVARVTVAPAGWFHAWGPLAGLLATLLVGVALLWYGRDRANLPADLRFTVREGEAQGVTSALGAPSALARALGLVADVPVLVGGRHLLGWVRPVDRELYEFRPVRGVQVDGNADPVVHVVVHRTYGIRADGRDYRVRFEYR